MAGQLFTGRAADQLSELAAGLAGGLATGDTGGAVTAGQAGKNAVENNALGCAGSSNPYCVGKNDLLTTGGGGPGPIAGGVGAAGALATGGDKDGAGQPNVGKDLSDEQKKELGGTGSGTPGGWGPEDEEGARNNEAARNGLSKDKLNQAASAPNRNGLTDAGRALQKHGGREGSVYSYTSQKAAVLNQEAQSIVNEILNNPNTKVESRIVFENKQKVTVVEATAPDGRALRFNADGSRLIGFREPSK
ncbi:VENN motif pre-toxin domain-containing protein [Erwinia persicina]|uniref:VENN motif pre-toxin domain-containing protein n=1 Tax=Erwinia persicina TaxID=55211 RepID=UPI0030CEA6F9